MKNTAILLLALVSVAACTSVAGSLLNKPEIPPEFLKQFTDAEKIEFLTTSSVPLGLEKARGKVPEDAEVETLQGFRILDKRVIADKEKIAMLISQLRRADLENNSKAAGCFNPRHALRLTTDHSQFALICFECLQVKLPDKGYALISSSPAARYNALAKELGMELEIKGE